MTAPITGGCACGAVRYVSNGEIEFAFHCFCRRCQRMTGGGHSSAFALPSSDVKMTGDVKYFKQVSDSGFATHAGFCPTCGSPVLSKTERFPDRLYMHVATLDDPSTFDPSFVVFEEAAQPWDHIDLKLQDTT